MGSIGECSFDSILQQYFAYHFHIKTLQHLEQLSDDDENDENDDEEDGDDDDQQDQDQDQLDYESMNQSLIETCKQLRCIGVDILLSGAVMQVVFDGVSNRIQRTCAGRFDRTLLDSRVFQWLNSIILPWSQSLLVQDHSSSTEQYSYTQWVTRLRFFVFDRFACMRIDELFDIIVEFPDSKPALHDLQRCLQQTNLLSKLTQSLTTAYESDKIG